MSCESRTLGRAIVVGAMVGWITTAIGHGCGTGSGDGSSRASVVVEGQPITVAHRQRFMEIEQCSDLSSPEPREEYLPVKPCPTSKRPCCMDDPRLPDHLTSDGHLAGYAGSLIDGVILLPEGTPCGDAFEHEAYRYLLEQNGDPRWDDSDLPNVPQECA